MSRRRIPDTFLTEEQQRRRQRNDKYRMKISSQIRNQTLEDKFETGQLRLIHVSNEGIQQTAELKHNEDDCLIKNPVRNEFKKNEVKNFGSFLSSLKMTSILILILSITSLMVCMQNDIYRKQNVPYGFYFALLSELAMLALVVIPFRGLKKPIAWLTGAGLFIYCLGLLSFDLTSDKHENITQAAQTEERTSIADDSIILTQKALALAIENKESGNISKLSKTLEELSANRELARAGNYETLSSHADLIEYKFNGLILLRALLMVFNLLLVHNLVEMWRPKAKLGA